MSENNQGEIEIRKVACCGEKVKGIRGYRCEKKMGGKDSKRERESS